MYGIYKNGTDEPICRAGLETEENSFVDIIREREGGMN